MKLNSRERILAIGTISIAAAALVYVAIVEPLQQKFHAADTAPLGYETYNHLITKQAEINQQYKKIFSSMNWKKTPEEQNVYFQMHIQKIAQSEHIQEIVTMRPLETNNASGYTELSLQLDVRCSVNALTAFLYRTTTDTLPMRITKLYIYSDENESQYLKAQMVISTLWMSPV